MKKMDQINARLAASPIYIESLSKEEHDKIIGSMLLIEEKRDESIKGRMVARGD